MNNSQELSTFSHEINNSLTLIYGQIQYIEKTNDILTQNEHWNRMKDDFSSLISSLPLKIRLLPQSNLWI